MLKRQIVALTTAVALAAFAGPLAFAQQPAPGRIAGTAKNEAKKPYTDYNVRARLVTTGAVAATAPLDTQANFVLQNLSTEKFLVELIRIKDNKVVCTEGPVPLSATKPTKSDVDISCGIPALAWLLPAAAAAGIAVAVTGEPASPAK